MIYTVTFNPALDYVIHVDHFRTGIVNKADKAQMVFGGKGINVAFILKELGLDVKARGFQPDLQEKSWNAVWKRNTGSPMISYMFQKG